LHSSSDFLDSNSLNNSDAYRFIASEIKKRLDRKIIPGKNSEYNSTVVDDKYLASVHAYSLLRPDEFPPISADTNEVVKDEIIGRFFELYLNAIELAEAPAVEAAALLFGGLEGGLESVKLYKRYFESTAPIPYDEINYNEGSSISSSFKSAVTTKKMIKIIEDQALAKIKLLVNDFYPSLQGCSHPAIDRYFDIEKIGVEEDYIHAIANRSTWGYSPVNRVRVTF
jgi:hypothetical protein